MTHTLGPLRVVGPAVVVLCEDGTTLLGGDCDILDEHDKVIAETYQHVGDDNVRPAHANAVLFAAAPTLLEACGAALEAIYAGAEPWMLADVEAKCRAAIASVTGEHEDQQ